MGRREGEGGLGEEVAARVWEGGVGEWRFLCRLHRRFLCRLLVLGGGGRGKASDGIEGGGEGEGALALVNAGIVAGKPREAQHQLEVC